MKNDRTMGLGPLLREYRRETRMTQAEVADIVGLERTSITNIEYGRQALTLENLSLISDALGLEVRIELLRVKEPVRRIPRPADHITVPLTPPKNNELVPAPAPPVPLADVTPRCRTCTGFGVVSAGAEYGTATCSDCDGTGVAVLRAAAAIASQEVGHG